MFKSILKLVRSDCRIIAHDPVILSLLSGPLLIIIILKLFFPVFSDIVYSKSGFHIKEYYPVIAITLVCLVPYLIGILYINILKDFQSSDLSTATSLQFNFLIIRMFCISFICFVFVLLTIIASRPVPTEGWLRNIFAACLLSIQAPFVCMLIGALMKKNVMRISVFMLCSIFLITVPFGLLVHHPWNYFAFFSPLYWLAWAWIIRSPVESLEYGIITLILTLVILIILTRNFLRKNTGK